MDTVEEMKGNERGERDRAELFTSLEMRGFFEEGSFKLRAEGRGGATQAHPREIHPRREEQHT